MKRASRVGSLGRVLPIENVEPDGLIITRQGSYQRIIECQRLHNALTADHSGQQAITRGLTEICRLIPDHGSLSITAQTDPIPLDEALAPDQHNVQLAQQHDLAHGREQLAAVRGRLLAAQTQSVISAAGSDQPAVAARWWVTVPYQPRAENPKTQLRDTLAQARGKRTFEAHQAAALGSLQLTGQIEAALNVVGIDSYPLDGPQTLACLWERLHPAAQELPDLSELAAAPAITHATTAAEASTQRHLIIRTLCDGPSPAAIDASDSRRLVHSDGTLEEVLHLGTPPLQTSVWWLLHLLSCPLPATVTVHIRVGSRARAHTRHRRRWRRLAAAIDCKSRRSRLVMADEQEALAEAQAIDAELLAEIGAAVYDVSIYCSLRDPRGEQQEFERLVSGAARQFHAHTNAKVVRGRRLCLPGFVSSPPIGVDELAARRSYAHRNIGHCLPLTSSSCGSPEGLILGFSDPMALLERIAPFDPLFKTAVTLLLGPSGGGKTVLMNALLDRAISQGMSGWIIDRSSTRDEHGSGAGSGHYDQLLALIPGSRRVQVGSLTGGVICPWDIRDPGNVPAERIEFLLALHALLIGETSAGGEDRHLTPVEESLLLTAIDRTYTHCAKTGERPRETVLREQLRVRGEQDELTGSSADILQTLMLRLAPYCEGGPLAHIADHPTTVEPDAPLTLFDISGLPDRLVPAMIFAIVGHIEGAVQHTRTLKLTGRLQQQGAWAGQHFLVAEEGWKITASAAAGSWLNEYARRARHYKLWLILVSQHLQDLNNEQGRALLEDSQLALFVQNTERDLAIGRDTIGLTDTDIEQITKLTTRKGLYSTVYVVSPRGRGAVRILLGDLEYWICSADPENDQPKRTTALTETGGDPWQALRLLCTPEWHDSHREHNTT